VWRQQTWIIKAVNVVPVVNATKTVRIELSKNIFYVSTRTTETGLQCKWSNEI
jgi:hypothetical protein